MKKYKKVLQKYEGRIRIRETYYNSLERLDLFSLFLGLVIANLTWAIQPEWSQARYLIEHGVFAGPFILMSYIFLLVIIGIISYRLIKKSKGGKK